MKIREFEKIIRKVVREEIDYALKREMDKLKKDLKKTKLVVKENTEAPVEEVENFRAKLREQFSPPNFNTGNDTLNSLLSETAITPTPEETFAANDPVNEFINKDYSQLMTAMDKKKDFRP